MRYKKIIIKITFLVLLFQAKAEERIGFLFVHGLGGNSTNIEFYGYSEWSIIQEPYWTFDFPDVGPHGDIIKERANLAQDEDIITLAHNYQAFIDVQKILDTPLDGIVLIGLSRGAATIINFVATRNPSLLKAVVLESPFDTVENVIQFYLKQRYLAWIPGVHACALFYFTHYLYPNYNPNGIKPLDVVADLPLDLPILFIHSLEDTLISIESSRTLLRVLRQTGHKYAYLLELTYGYHGKYQLCSDSQLYEKAVHAFFHKFSIPFYKKDWPILD
ncbi:MAG: alpha/beta fold hydrolase [Candidatus Babeliaceae bacterium]